MPPGQQAGSPQACPESICILGCDIVRVPLDASSAVHSRSPSRLAPDALLELLFLNVHHPGHGAGAACGSLEPPPARRFRGAYPHRQRSIASGCLIYIGLPSTFVAQQTSGLQLKTEWAEMVVAGSQNHPIRFRTQAGNAIATACVAPRQKHKL